MDLKAITPHLQLMMSASQEVVDSLMALELGWIVVAVALLYLGLAVAGVLLWLIRFIYVYFLRPGKNLKFYGSWAMITGATDGIGKAYCIELAEKGAIPADTLYICHCAACVVIKSLIADLQASTSF